MAFVRVMTIVAPPLVNWMGRSALAEGDVVSLRTPGRVTCGGW